MKLRSALLGILNVTPDSFSDGGRFGTEASAVAQGVALLAAGAAGVDVGGESTRPGATPVPIADEIRRVVPVILGLRAAAPDAWLSVDTRHAAVAAAALEAGADTVNDVSGLADPDMLGVVARRGAGLVVMHALGTPQTMQSLTTYADLEGEVEAFLTQRVAQARAAGVARLWVDPGIGFAKAPEDNPRLIRMIPRLARLAPVLVGASRKRFIGELTGEPDPARRDAGSIGAAIAAAAVGAAVLRVHDVRGTRHALTVYEACS